MSRDFQDPDQDPTRDDQSELAFAPGGPRRAAGDAEPSRAEFFRTRRRPVLPLLGLVGAVATVAAFLWLGRAETPPSPAAPSATPPVASAPGGEVPFPEAQPPATGPSPVAEAGSPDDAAPPLPGEPAASADFAALGTTPNLPPVASAAAPIQAPVPAAIPAPAASPAAGVAKQHPAAPAPAHKAAAAGHGGYSVQLLAARSEAQAGGAWQKLRGAHPELLASLSPNISATERAGSGTFYRLRAGPLHDRAAADALCKKLSARSQSCFVVAPGS